MGEANDSVGKSMSGGTLVVCPGPGATLTPQVNAIFGNGALYGATGGRCFARGLIRSPATETDSATALVLLGDWPGTLETFAPFLPVALAQSLR